MNTPRIDAGFEVSVVFEHRPPTGNRFKLDAEFRSDGGITVLFGPSGAGKSTLALAVLGALRPSRGRISVAGRTLYDSERGIDLPVRRRRVGIVFQDALLFPHLNVRANVAFGSPPPDAGRHADRMLERVGATLLAERMPCDLSGGERQRVALARALAAGPDVLLLDEPFSSLDRPARDSLATLLVDLQRTIRVPFLHITHDLGEALRIGHLLVLMDEGRVVQTGEPDAITRRPGSAAAARAVGTENLFTGVVRRNLPEEGYSEIDLGGTIVETALVPEKEGSRIALGLRAEDVLVATEEIRGTSARNVLPGTVEEIRAHGTGLELRITTPVPFRVIVTPAAGRELRLRTGSRLFLLIKANAFQRLV